MLLCAAPGDRALGKSQQKSHHTGLLPEPRPVPESLSLPCTQPGSLVAFRGPKACAMQVRFLQPVQLPSPWASAAAHRHTARQPDTSSDPPANPGLLAPPLSAPVRLFQSLEYLYLLRGSAPQVALRLPVPWRWAG